jgi:Domain of unknown function (DUF4279)
LEIDVRGLKIEPAPDGWCLCREPIPPTRIRLMQGDRTPEPRHISSVALSFVATGLSIDEMTLLAGIEPDRAAVDDGEVYGLEPGRLYSSWLIETGDRYAALERQVDLLIERIAEAEHGLTQLSAASEQTTFSVRSEPSSWHLARDAADLLERVGATPHVMLG